MLYGDGRILTRFEEGMVLEDGRRTFLCRGESESETEMKPAMGL